MLTYIKQDQQDAVTHIKRDDDVLVACGAFWVHNGIVVDGQAGRLCRACERVVTKDE